MTLNDFLSRVDIEKDGWSNLDIDIRENEIRLLPDINNSPFSSDK